MNLAIEYFIRSGELKNNLKFPYSLFIMRLNSGEKIVVTIHQKKGDPKRLIVKHWLIGKCRESQRIPSFDEFEIEAEELFTSRYTVVPKCFPLWYTEETYTPPVRLNCDFPFTDRQEQEYNQTVDNFLNSSKHRRLRDEWLWTAFLNIYMEEANTFVRYYAGDRIKTLADNAPHLKHTWMMWRKYFLDYSTEVGDVASELLFHGEYSHMLKRSSGGHLLL